MNAYILYFSHKITLGCKLKDNTAKNVEVFH